MKLALEWVRDNIVAFGGSPDRVTMFGQSAGGAITSHVMISPETQGLLARGICGHAKTFTHDKTSSLTILKYKLVKPFIHNYF